MASSRTGLGPTLHSISHNVCAKSPSKSGALPDRCSALWRSAKSHPAHSAGLPRRTVRNASRAFGRAKSACSGAFMKQYHLGFLRPGSAGIAASTPARWPPPPALALPSCAGALLCGPAPPRPPAAPRNHGACPRAPSTPSKPRHP
eukprot:3585874-Pyramimonas_sp.AAC.1